MSNLIFPTLPGCSVEIGRSPSWESTVQRSVSGRSIGITAYTYPLWKYRVSFEFLRAGGVSELEQIVGFFNKHRGRTDTWLFLDEDDYLVTNQQIGLGDGVTTSFQLVRSYGGFVEPITEPKQFDSVKIGGVEQSSAARTNLLTWSERLWDTAYWTVGATLGGFYAATQSTEVPDIYGAAGPVTKFVAAASTAELFLRKPLTLSAGQTKAPSIYIRVPSQAGVTSWGLRCDFADVESGAMVTFTTFDQWVRVPASAITPAADRSFIDFNIYRNGVAPVPGFTFYAMGAQLEAGSTPTTYIKTTSAPSTVIDYTHAGGGRLLFATPPAAGLSITWSGQFYRRCRFDDDALDTERFLYRLWRAKSVDFTTEKG